MLRLRPYKPCDAPVVLSWIRDETALRKWSADRLGAYPVMAEDLNRHYWDPQGACAMNDAFYPMTAFDESGVVGHLILRFTDEKKTILRFGFVIVDDKKRGKGYGKEMLRLALRYAFDLLQAEKVALGVFENNPAAYFCYRSVGFRLVPSEKEKFFEIMGQK